MKVFKTTRQTSALLALGLALTLGTTANALAPLSNPKAECELIPANAQVYTLAAGTGISEQTFNKIMDEIERIYTPIFKARGATFKVERLWTDATVNAYATQNGNEWVITMFGGLARHRETTPDAMAAVACHEIGHHLGGQPKYDGGMNWAAAEGQADYFATAKCMRLMFEKSGKWMTAQHMAEVRRMAADPTVEKECSASFSNKKDHDACLRSSAAGLALARLLADLGGTPMPLFDTPDTSEVSVTDENHPAAQCRLDTYFHGATCTVDKSVDFSDKDVATGACMKPTSGFRPACWFADPATHPQEPKQPEQDPGSDSSWPWPKLTR